MWVGFSKNLSSFGIYEQLGNVTQAAVLIITAKWVIIIYVPIAEDVT
jgi:hypothetical protein